MTGDDVWAMPLGDAVLGDAVWAMSFGRCRLGDGRLGDGTLGDAVWANGDLWAMGYLGDETFGRFLS